MITKIFQKSGIQIFLVTAIITILTSAILSHFIRINTNSNSERVVHTYEVLQNTGKLLSYLKDAETGQRGYLLIKEESYLEPFNRGKAAVNQTLDSLKLQTSDNPLQQERLSKISGLVNEKFEELSSTIQMANDSTGLAQALSIVRSGKGKVLMDKIRALVTEMENTERDLLTERNLTLAQNQEISNMAQWIAAILTSAILFVAINVINKERAGRKNLFREMETNNRKLLFDEGNKEQTVHEEDAVNGLINNLDNAKSFIKGIGEGDYTINYEGITEENKLLNNDNLAGALLDMRDQMKQVAEEERKRNWATEGLANFAEILRANHKDVQLLYDSIIANLIKYLNASQGGLFVLNDSNDSEEYLELVASYAYNRRKHLNKQIQQGEGLVGQVLLEKEMIYMTDIPEGYLKITSGLGEALPKQLIIIPLKVNDEVHGVVELASFNFIEEYQREFLLKVAENIASTISMSKINNHTRVLLEAAQQQGEEMRAQEEEMRQNMEELSATQEEMHRKEKEYQRRIIELEQNTIKA